MITFKMNSHIVATTKTTLQSLVNSYPEVFKWVSTVSEHADKRKTIWAGSPVPITCRICVSGWTIEFNSLELDYEHD